jgi:L-asparaginase
MRKRTTETASAANRRQRTYLRHLRLPDTEVNVVPLMNKDSLGMTDQDRLVILGMVRAILQENAPIVITHGTDTMVETALYLQRALEAPVMPIVLTGAMTPLGFEGSDGLQNLTESLLAVQLVRPGVYVVMHGRCIRQTECAKTTCLGGWFGEMAWIVRTRPRKLRWPQ